MSEHAVGRDLVRRWRDRASASAAAAVADAEELTVSPAQTGLLLFEELHPGTAVNILSFVASVAGPVDRDRLRSALVRMAERHPLLRARFPREEPPRCVLDPVAGSVAGSARDHAVNPAVDSAVDRAVDAAVDSVTVPSAVPSAVPYAGPEPEFADLTDLAHLPEDERREAAMARAGDFAARPMDPATGPLWRVAVWSLGPDETLLQVVAHHLICDGWSLGVFLAELTTLYSGGALPGAATPPAAGTPVTEADLAYWRERLCDAPPLDLPADMPRPVRPRFRSGAVPVSLDTSAVRHALEVAERERVTPFMVLLAALHLTLARTTGEPDVTIGAPIAAGERHRAPGAIAPLVNMLALRTDSTGAATGRDLLMAVRDTCLGAYAHAHVPLETVAAEARTGGDRLFRAMCVLQDGLPEFHLDGRPVRPLTMAPAAIQYDVEMYLWQTGDRVTGFLGYDADLFDAETVRLLAGRFGVALRALTEGLDGPLTELDVLGEAEKTALGALGDGGPLAGDDGCVHGLIEAVVDRCPDAVAVRAVDGVVRYRELDERAERLACHLVGLGARAGVLVGVCLPRSSDLIVALLAVLKTGAAYVPIDPGYPPERVAYLLDDSNAAVLVTTPDHSPLASSPGVQVVDIGALLGPIGGSPDAGRVGRLGVEVRSSDAAYVIYTSGSTGRPKGVVIEHRQTVAMLTWAGRVFGPGVLAETLASTSVCFDLSVFEIFAPLSVGATVTLAAGNALDLIEDRAGFGHVTLVNTVPSAAAELLAAGAIPPRAATINLAGEPLPVELVRGLYRDPAVGTVNNLYGPTEDTTYSTHAITHPGDERTPLGRALPGSRVHLLDSELRPVPLGAIGEVYLSGQGVTRGYHHRPALTAERYLPLPDNHAHGDALTGSHGDSGGDQGGGGRLYRTGDLARWRPRSSADGGVEFFLDYHGRVDHQVKLRGFRIEPGEVEHVLLQHPAVSEAVVTVHRDHLIAHVATKHTPGHAHQGDHDDVGQSDQRAHGEYAGAHDVHGDRRDRGHGGRLVVVADHGDLALSDEDCEQILLRYLRGCLPQHLVPARVVVMDALPRTPNGKIDRKALPAPSLASAGAGEVEPPSTEAQRLVAGLFAGLLGRPVTSIHDDFFSLGGHSLLATRLVHRLSEALGVVVPLRLVFDHPTVAELAEQLPGVAAGAVGGVAAIPVGRHPAGEHVHPATANQQRLWFLCHLHPDTNLAYHITGAATVRGPLDRDRLHTALAHTARRHESLRTTLRMTEGELLQVVHDEWDWEPPLTVAPDLAGTLQQWRTSTVDLEQGPLFRARVVRVSDDEHVLLLSLHHVIADGWSLTVLFRELAAHYEAACAGDPLPQDAPLQHGDYAQWKLDTPADDSELDFWRGYLAGAQTLDLPTDKPRPPYETHRGDAVPLALPARTVERLARESGTTTFTVITTALTLLLARLTGQDDVTIGIPSSGRTHPGTADMIGFLANTLPLRSVIRPGMTLAEALRATHANLLEVQLHGDTPFERIVQHVRPERDFSRSPFFQVMLALDSSPQRSLELPGLRFTRVDMAPAGTQFELSVHLEQSVEGLGGFLTFNTDLFDVRSACLLAERLAVVVEALAAGPQVRVADLDVRTAGEKAVLGALGDGGPLAGDDGCVHGLIEAVVDRCPDAVAVRAVDGVVRYRELDERAERLACHLVGLGARAGVLVGVCLPRSSDLIVALLAVLKTGAAYVPIDPGYPRERVAYLLDDSNAAVLVTTPDHNPLAGSAGVEVVNVRAVLGPLAAEASVGSSAPGPGRLGVGLRPSDAAYVIYTSGSTGRPKGVVIEHRQTVAMLTWAGSVFGPGVLAETLASTSVCFDLSVFEIFAPLSVGATVTLAAGNALDLIEDRAGFGHVTLVNTVPSAAAELLAAGAIPPRAATINLAGEPLPVELVRGLYRDPAVGVVNNLYGPTEDTTYSTHAITHPGDERTPLGRALPGSRVHLLDSELRPVPLGAIGEVYLSGQGVTRGYHHRPGLTAERYLPLPGNHDDHGDDHGGDARALTDSHGDNDGDAHALPAGEGGRLYRTGDLARWRPRSTADGEVEFFLDYHGRVDHQVKLRGFRIEPGEVEHVLLQHPAVSEAVVTVHADHLIAHIATTTTPNHHGDVGRHDHTHPEDVGRHPLDQPGQGRYAQGDQRAHGEHGEHAGAHDGHGDRRDRGHGGRLVVVADHGDLALSDEDCEQILLRYLRGCLPQHLVPARVVVMDALPRTPNGKIDRKALPAPSLTSAGAGEVEPPSTEAQRLVAGLFTGLLGRPVTSIHDDFFSLGGHSLLATRLVHRLSEALGVVVPLRLVFDHPTVAELAEQLPGLGAGEVAAIPVGRHPAGEHVHPATANQQRLWFLCHLHPDTNLAYHITGAATVRGPLDRDVLHTALAHTARRHESLRTTLREENEELVQVVSAEPVAELEEVTVSDWAAVLDEVASRPLDIAAGPLMRAVLVRVSEEEHVLLLSLHHLICDGWSLDLLLREITGHYARLAEDPAGDQAPSPAPVQFADVALWEQPVTDEDVEFWREHLAGARTLDLPTDKPRPPYQTHRGDAVPLSLPAEAVAAVTRATGASTFSVVATALGVLLAKLSGQDDVTIGFAASGRTRPETTDVIGMLVTTLPLRMRPTPETTLRDVLSATHDSALAVQQHQHIGFERLINECVRERDLSRSPLFQVMLSINGTPPQYELPGLAVDPVPVHPRASQFELSVHLEQSVEGLGGFLTFNTDLFDVRSACLLAERLAVVVEALAAGPQVRVADLDVRTAGEKAVLGALGDGGPLAGDDGCVHGLIEAVVDRCPDAVAVRAVDGVVRYRELDERAERLACHLVGLGARAGVLVGVCLPRSSDLIVALLAVLKTGAAYVPIDPGYPPERVAYLLDDSNAAVLVTTPDHNPLAGSAGVEVVDVRAVLGSAGDGFQRRLGVGVRPSDAAYVIYTSGSTGRPKGVVIEHRQTVAMLAWAGRVFGPGVLAETLASTSVCFDLSVFEIFAPLSVGAAVTLAAGNALDLIEDRAGFGHVTLVNTVPSAAAELLAAGAIPSRAATINLAGEPLPVELVRGLYRDPAVEAVNNLYGPTEDTTYSTHAVTDPKNERTPLGRALPGSRVHLLDSELRPVPLGAIGEVYLSGQGVTRGYHHRPALTAERYLPLPDGEGGRLYRTGDLARWRPRSTADGEVEFFLDYHGRVDHQVKLRGFRIEPGEVEHALLQHPAVSEAVVTVHRDHLIAHIAATTTPTEEGEEEQILLRHLRGCLPQHLVPARIVVMDALPRTPNGKIDRKALPEPTSVPTTGEAEPPSTEAQHLVAELFAGLLGRPVTNIHDDFFSLGGHSLLATRLVSRLNALTGASLPLRVVFEHPTIAGLAESLPATASGPVRPAAIPRLRRTLGRTGATSGAPSD
uniref:non-ribosomal peptide synthetase n=1 Tax=Microbispora cellulosiformans TaxID=2614688 RepID=UPI001782E322|nr:non-ribosomal peptide synthetase [Microbispora cellulosiformans]